VRCPLTPGGFAKPHASAVILTFGSLEFGPLVGCEDVANSEEHPGICFFELGAGLSGMVDLREDLVGVGLVCSKEWTHELLLLIEVGVQVHQLRAILLKDIVHSLLLVGGQGKFLDEVSVVPPDTRRPEAEPHPTTPGATARFHLAGGAARWKRGAIGLLGQG
jgi:hypothetical protein